MHVVVVRGRAFLRRLIDLTCGVRHGHFYIRSTTSVKDDLRMWLHFLQSFNGRSFFLDEEWLSSDTPNLYIDVAGSLAYGAVFGDQCCYGSWLDHWKSTNIAVLEFFPIVLSVRLWGHEMSNKRIIFFTGNASLVDIINKAASRDTTAMQFIRQLVLACFQHNIMFRARHAPGC